MKLVYRIILRISILLVLFLSVWLLYFYHSAVNELYDEIDDSLRYQANSIIERVLETDTIPISIIKPVGNNSYSIERVSDYYAETHQEEVFYDETIYIDDIVEEEPARVMTKVFTMDGQFYELQILTPTFERKDVLYTIMQSAAILVIILIITIIFSVGFIVIGSMKPMYNLLDWLKTHNVGDAIPEYNDVKFNTSEFKQIKDAVIDSTQRSNQVYEQQKRFIGNASHEIQTPLAVCKNRLELLIDNSELSEYQINEIEKTLNTIDYISKLNKSLLFISKIDNHQFDDEESNNINKVSEDLLMTFNDVYLYKNIKTILKDKNVLKVIMNKTLCISLISNLLKNAFEHNTNNGDILIIIDDKSISFENIGTDKPLNDNLIFERFYKDGNNENSTGLGLPIVKAICDLYRFELIYKFENQRHRFIVNF